MATDYELTLQDYLSIMRRHVPYLVGVFIAVLLVSIIVAITLTPTYMAVGTIMVESQQVPESMVANTEKSPLDERINTIKQRVMTRESMLQLANKYDLFKGHSSFITSAELIEKMRSRVGVELMNNSNSQGNNRGKVAIAFNLSFEDRSAETAYKVTKDLVTLFLDWNIKLRTDGATETKDFLSQEADKLKLEVERQESLITVYKRQNSNHLPEQLNLRMTMLARAENDLREIERDSRSTKEELRTLQAELAAANYGAGGTPSQSLPDLRAELARLSSIYNESHPDIKTLKRKIESLEKVIETPESEASSNKAPTLAVYKIQAKIESANVRLDSFAKQQKMLQGTISQNENAMMLTPKVGQELDMLLRDRDSALKKYEEIQNKKMSAQISESLEIESKSERFILLEPPMFPEKPYKPNRVKIIAMGFFLALAASAAILVALAMLDKNVRGADALTHVLGFRPLVVIPYLIIKEEMESKKRLRKSAIIAAIGLVIALILALHFLYMPLNELFTKILARLI